MLLGPTRDRIEGSSTSFSFDSSAVLHDGRAIPFSASVTACLVVLNKRKAPEHKDRILCSGPRAIIRMPTRRIFFAVRIACASFA